jgi:ribosomal-protein-alanine N-acetyltransferase
MSAVLKQERLIEPMRERDLPSVMDIERRIYAFPWTQGNFLDSLRTGYGCWVLREADVLVGYAVVAVAAGEAHLLNLSIAERQQRRGYGGVLLSHLVEVARAHRAGTLFLEVRPSNESGRHLYRKHGFRRIGVRRDYYPARGGREDAWVLALAL